MRNQGRILRQGWEGQAGELDQGFEMPRRRSVERAPQFMTAIRHRREARQRDQLIALGDAGELGAGALQGRREPVDPDQDMSPMQQRERGDERNGPN
jgi:hypothetical protein